LEFVDRALLSVRGDTSAKNVLDLAFETAPMSNGAMVQPALFAEA
jgi:hypothetical protein